MLAVALNLDFRRIANGRDNEIDDVSSSSKPRLMEDC